MSEPVLDFLPVVTEAGLASANAADLGGFKVDITHIAVGSEGYTVAASDLGYATQTELLDEQQRVTIQDARVIGDGQTDLSFVVDGDGDYPIREIGIYQADGTLFAVAAHPTKALMFKTPNTLAAIAVELVLSGVSPDLINIISTGPPLTLLFTKEIATLSAWQMRTQLTQLLMGDQIRKLQEAAHG